MPKGSYGLSPNQIEAQRIPLEEILAKADSLPPPVKARTVEDMQPLVQKLRDEKGMSWPEVADWMRTNTEFYRSGQFWKNIYNGKRIGVIQSVKEIQPPTSQQNEQ